MPPQGSERDRSPLVSRGYRLSRVWTRLEVPWATAPGLAAQLSPVWMARSQTLVVPLTHLKSFPGDSSEACLT
eukprot:4598376-Amphidinium_carterae.4